MSFHFKNSTTVFFFLFILLIQGDTCYGMFNKYIQTLPSLSIVALKDLKNVTIIEDCNAEDCLEVASEGDGRSLDIGFTLKEKNILQVFKKDDYVHGKGAEMPVQNSRFTITLTVKNLNGLILENSTVEELKNASLDPNSPKRLVVAYDEKSDIALKPDFICSKGRIELKKFASNRSLCWLSRKNQGRDNR